MVKKQEKNFINIKERNNGYTYLLICRITIKYTILI